MKNTIQKIINYDKNNMKFIKTMRMLSEGLLIVGASIIYDNLTNINLKNADLEAFGHRKEQIVEFYYNDNNKEGIGIKGEIRTSDVDFGVGAIVTIGGLCGLYRLRRKRDLEGNIFYL